MNEKKINYIAEAIQNNYDINIDDAIEIVSNSFIIDFAQKYPDYVNHYDAEYWANEIMEAQNVR